MAFRRHAAAAAVPFPPPKKYLEQLNRTTFCCGRTIHLFSRRPFLLEQPPDGDAKNYASGQMSRYRYAGYGFEDADEEEDEELHASSSRGFQTTQRLRLPNAAVPISSSVSLPEPVEYFSPHEPYTDPYAEHGSYQPPEEPHYTPYERNNSPAFSHHTPYAAIAVEHGDVTDPGLYHSYPSQRPNVPKSRGAESRSHRTGYPSQQYQRPPYHLADDVNDDPADDAHATDIAAAMAMRMRMRMRTMTMIRKYESAQSELHIAIGQPMKNSSPKDALTET